jgi:SAM-dependent methyltransferase
MKICEIPILQDDIVDMWESVSPAYPKAYDPELTRGEKRVFDYYEKRIGRRFKRIIDCGCGTGNASIGLKKKYGYEVLCVDSSKFMIDKLKKNIKKEKCSIEVLECDWRDLKKHFISSKEKFDIVICRGNSLIYVNSWEKNSLLPNVAVDGIKESLLNFYEILNPRGILYIDITNRKEFNSKSSFEFIGKRDDIENKQSFIIYWNAKHELKNKIRYVHAYRLFYSNVSYIPTQLRFFRFTSYLLLHEELLNYMSEVGFKITRRDMYLKVNGEFLYDVFVGIKN